MIFSCSLQSGSNGNCIYVETSDARLLIDAGISGRCAATRLVQHGRDMRNVNALLISHNHADHVRGAGVFHRRFHFPVFLTDSVFRHCREKIDPIRKMEHFHPGDVLSFGQTHVHTVPTAHDGIDGVAFVIESAGRKLGVFTDLGHNFPGLQEWVSDLDGVFLESNYDPAMLAAGPYPPWLQNRIRGDGGHLSNDEAATLLHASLGRLRWAVLSHLSEHNNTPDLALNTVRKMLTDRLPLAVASRYDVSPAFLID